MAVIAKHCPQFKILVVDKDESKIQAWNGSCLPIYEPHLLSYIEQCRGRNLFFTTNVDEAIRESEVIFIAVNTPTKKYGHWVSFFFYTFLIQGRLRL